MSQPGVSPEPDSPVPLDRVRLAGASDAAEACAASEPADASDADNAIESAAAIRRMKAIYRKARELGEERGIKAGYLATGLARWG